MQKPAIAFLLICLLLGCGKESVKRDIINMTGKNIKIDSCRMISIVNDKNKTPFVLISYLDSMECKSCATSNMHKWDAFAKPYSKNNKLEILSILSSKSKDSKYLSVLIETMKIKHNVLIDTMEIFPNQNSFIPKSSLLHVFLIKRDSGEILLVGDPRKSQKIKSLLDHIITRS